MALRPQPYRLKWPLTPNQVEGVDEMLQILFKKVRDLEIQVAGLTGTAPPPAQRQMFMIEQQDDSSMWGSMVPGPQGLQGPQGAPGLSIPGLDGEEGAMGPIGLTGATGAAGAAGATGATGSPGMDGQDGDEAFEWPVANGAADGQIPRLNRPNTFLPNTQTFYADGASLALKLVGRVTGDLVGMEMYANNGTTLQGYFQCGSSYFILASAVGYCAINGSTYVEFDSGGVESMRLHASGGLSLGDSTDPGDNNFRLTGIVNFAGTNTTGAGIAAFGANSPASTLTSPYTWIQIKTSDGSTAYIPCWK